MGVLPGMGGVGVEAGLEVTYRGAKQLENNSSTALQALGTINIGTATSKIVVVAIPWGRDSGTSGSPIVTCAGVTLTNDASSATSGKVNTILAYGVVPATGAQALTVKWSTIYHEDSSYHVYTVTGYTSTTPTSSFAKATAASATLTLSSTPGQVLIGCAISENSARSPTSANVTIDQTFNFSNTQVAFHTGPASGVTNPVINFGAAYDTAISGLVFR